MRALEFVTIDDVWQDRKVLMPHGHGSGGPCRLLQMGAMDMASAVYLIFGIRPELPRDDGTRERLKERDAKELVAMLLERYGYPLDYVMTIVCERGTATIRPADALALYHITNGQVRICYTSMEGDLVLVWADSSTGNSRGKGLHESWHNLFHNEMASLPGQVGKDNAHQPAMLPAMEKEARSLVTASHFLTEEQRLRLRYPFPSVAEAHRQTLDAVDRINRRRDHDCEGFDEVLEWKLKGTEMALLPQSALCSLDKLSMDLVEWVRRRETPAERLARLSAGVRFAKPPGWVLARFYEDNHFQKAVIKDRFAFEKDGRKFSFKPPEGTMEPGEFEGREFLGYCRSIDPEVVHLMTEDGKFVGTWIREKGITRGDSEALSKAIREKTTLLNTAIGNVRRQQRDFIEQEEARMRQNQEVLSEAGLLRVEDGKTGGREDGRANEGMRELNAAVRAAEGAKAARRSAKEEKERLEHLAAEVMAAAPERSLRDE
jgi:hypothetical protein